MNLFALLIMVLTAIAGSLHAETAPQEHCGCGQDNFQVILTFDFSYTSIVGGSFSVVIYTPENDEILIPTLNESHSEQVLTLNPTTGTYQIIFKVESTPSERTTLGSCIIHNNINKYPITFVPVAAPYQAEDNIYFSFVWQ